jgi:hypothetical protein
MGSSSLKPGAFVRLFVLALAITATVWADQPTPVLVICGVIMLVGISRQLGEIQLNIRKRQEANQP